MSEPDATLEGRNDAGPRYRANQPQKKGWRRLFTWKALALYVLGFFLLVAGAVAVAFATIDVPEPNDFSTSETSIVYYDDGETELGRLGAENREIVNSEQIPDTLKQAVIAAEDRSFYDNPGFSVTGIARAAWDQVRGTASAGGGSTITQQYVKNYYLTQEQTLSRKLQEFVIAVKIDQSIDKDQILTDYLNTIWFGRGTYGVQTASQAYFGVEVEELDLAQSAALAAILRSPASYDPTQGEENEARFEERFRYVLNGMVTTGAIDRSTAENTEPPEVRPEERENRFGGTDGYLLLMVRDELRERGFDDSEIEAGGLRVTTSFNEQAQEAAVRAVSEERPTENAERVHVGLSAVRPGDGGIVALYGGEDAVEQGFNNAVDARVQPGSIIKPFTLAAALENGHSLYSRFAGNSPYAREGLGSPVENQGNRSWGASVDLLQATERSVNTAFVDLVYSLSPQTVIDALARAGIPEDAPGLEPNARVTLGIASLTSLEMSEAYATLAAQGVHTDTYTVSEVRNSAGDTLYEREIVPEQAFEPDVTADVTYALRQVVESWRGTGQVARSLERPVAGKTGTHEELTSWFAGYTPQLATSVTYFRGDGSEAGTESLNGVGGMDNFAGGAYPARTWTAFMRAALEGEPAEEFPERANVNMYSPAQPPSNGGGSGDGGGDGSGGDESGQDESGDENGGDESGQDESGQDESGQDESGNDENGGDESGDENGGDESGQDESGDENGGDESGQDESGQDESGQDESGNDENGGDESGNENGGGESGNENGGDDGTEWGDDGSGDNGEGNDTGAETSTTVNRRVAAAVRTSV
ncbi:transglycosylase domain-containing protein [Phytoactinopolyspora halophila]|uniref:Penicillin-binding protein n=1 Tax=Phytoactinopolyspora halophila TaxID=1981511 RepID=A0A329R749_9ACTN|nr:transglycosylase domain-containing protein [Phytoactinopolyspora halophila]RAW18908.1 penicillin-binding protein [Phytoactinopolyspora halophila]